MRVANAGQRLRKQTATFRGKKGASDCTTGSQRRNNRVSHLKGLRGISMKATRDLNHRREESATDKGLEKWIERRRPCGGNSKLDIEEQNLLVKGTGEMDRKRQAERAENRGEKGAERVKRDSWRLSDFIKPTRINHKPTPETPALTPYSPRRNPLTLNPIPFILKPVLPAQQPVSSSGRRGIGSWGNLARDLGLLGG